jgi:hypothetical protein
LRWNTSIKIDSLADSAANPASTNRSEDRFVAVRLETLDPAKGGSRTLEEGRFIEHADERERQTKAARMNQKLSVIVQGGIEPGYRQQRGCARYSCRLSTLTTIGTLEARTVDERSLDKLPNVRRLTPQVARLSFVKTATFQGGTFCAGICHRPKVRAQPCPVSIHVEKPGFKPAMVVLHLIFCQV